MPRKGRGAVGSRNYQNKPMVNPFIQIIVEFQHDLQEKENKKKGKKKKISFVYAQIEWLKENGKKRPKKK